MSKKVKSIIICSAVLLVLVAALLVLLFMPQENGGDTDISSETSSSSLIELVKEDYTELESILVKNADDEFEIAKTGEREWSIPELAEFTQRSGYDTIANSLSGIYASSIVKENCTDFAEFGLANPRLTLTLAYSGSKHTLEVGDETITSTVYVRKDGTDTVYEVAASKFEEMMKTKLDFLELSVIPAAGTDSAGASTFTVVNAAINRPDLEKPLVFEEYSQAELDAGIVASTNLHMTSPIVCDLKQKGVTDYIVANFGLTAQSAVLVNPSDEQIAEYGFDEPSSVFELKYTVLTDEETGDKETRRVTITTGYGINADGTLETQPSKIVSYYLMRDDTNMVYLAAADDLKWLTVQAKDVISPIVAIPSITTIDNITIRIDNDEYTLDYIRGEGDPDDTNEYTATLNGAKVDIDAAKKYLQLLFMPEAADINTEEISGNPYMTYTYNLMSGEKITVDIYVKADRTTVIGLNGAQNFIGRAGFVEKAAKEMENLKNGNPVDTDW